MDTTKVAYVEMDALINNKTTTQSYLSTALSLF